MPVAAKTRLADGRLCFMSRESSRTPKFGATAENFTVMYAREGLRFTKTFSVFAEYAISSVISLLESYYGEHNKILNRRR